LHSSFPFFFVALSHQIPHNQLFCDVATRNKRIAHDHKGEIRDGGCSKEGKVGEAGRLYLRETQVYHVQRDLVLSQPTHHSR
jgi:hypothetical protein